jgi:homoserine O-acetyltransferase
VAAEKALPASLGNKHLVAVAGPSYGGYQAFRWPSATRTSWTGSSPRHRPRSQNAERSLAELQARLAIDPEWNGGWYYDTGGAKTVLTELRIEMLKRNGIEAALGARHPELEAREGVIGEQAAD